MNKKLLAVAITASLGLTGCMSTQVKMSEYSAVSLQSADILPTKESLLGEKQKIVIFPADTKNSALASKSKTGMAIATNLETYLSEVGVEIVDRTVASKLKKELQLAEAKGKSKYEGPQVANFTITGNVSNASISSKFHEYSSTIIDGKLYETAAHCTFSTSVAANLKLYKLPGLAYSKTIPIKGSASLNSDTTNSRCPINKSTTYSLINKAAQDGVRTGRTEFQNYFAPKAYVLERKTKEGQSIFKISAGKNLGFVPESKITFYNLSVSKNPLTGVASTEEYSVVEGTVTANLIGDDFAWILVDDENADKIKLGDYVKVTYDRSVLGDVVENLSLDNLLSL